MWVSRIEFFCGIKAISFLALQFPRPSAVLLPVDLFLRHIVPIGVMVRYSQISGLLYFVCFLLLSLLVRCLCRSRLCAFNCGTGARQCSLRSSSLSKPKHSQHLYHTLQTLHRPTAHLEHPTLGQPLWTCPRQRG